MVMPKAGEIQIHRLAACQMALAPPMNQGNVRRILQMDQVELLVLTNRVADPKMIFVIFSIW